MRDASIYPAKGTSSPRIHISVKRPVRPERSRRPFDHSVIRSFIRYADRTMRSDQGVCAFPECDQPPAPPPRTGGRSRYCDDPDHNPTTAYRARRRRSATAPARAEADPARLRERFERDLTRLEATIADARRAFAPPAASVAAADARVAELEHELAEATWGRTAAEAALEVAIEQTREAAEHAGQAETSAREWMAEALARTEQLEAERARAAEAERSQQE